MKKIILCPNPVRDVDLSYSKEIQRLLEACGAEVTLSPHHYIVNDRTPVCVDREVLLAQLQTADLIIGFGGDGTLLHLAHLAAPQKTPILTVNMGNKGFIAELEAKDTEKIIEIAMMDSYKIQERMMVDVHVWRDGQMVYEGLALNDVVVRGTTRVVNIEVYGDGEQIMRYVGDGIIISTPTGSTAYSMSAGGPLIEPNAKNIAITPICAHALVAKGFVLDPNRAVTVKLSLGDGKMGYLAVDGGSVELEDQDEIEVTQSAHVTQLVKASRRSFFEIVNAKLGLEA